MTDWTCTICGIVGHHEQDCEQWPDPCPICGEDHDRITRSDCPEWESDLRTTSYGIGMHD